VPEHKPQVHLESNPLDAREDVDLAQALLEQTLQLWVQVARLLLEAEPDLLAFYAFPLSTARSYAPPIRWSGSTARSAAAPTSSGYSPTTPHCCVWRAAC